MPDTCTVPLYIFALAGIGAWMLGYWVVTGICHMVDAVVLAIFYEGERHEKGA